MEKDLTHYIKDSMLAIVHIGDAGSFSYLADVRDLRHLLTNELYDHLEMIGYTCPTWKDDVSLPTRTLINLGLAEQVSYNTKQDYIAATPLGYEVLRVKD